MSPRLETESVIRPNGTGGWMDRLSLKLAHEALAVAIERDGLTWKNILEADVMEVFATADSGEIRSALAKVSETALDWIDALETEEAAVRL